MFKRRFITGAFSAFLLMSAAGCTDQNDTTDNDDVQVEQNEEHEGHGKGMDHSMHSSSGEVPEGLAEAQNPQFEVGSTAVINADHMPGMNGEEAEITGAYDTVVYAVTYTPTDGGEPVENHKWVIHEELENPGSEPLEAGAEVTLNADHMSGMEGASAEIVSSEETTVYMVTFVTTDTEEEVENHKWVTEEELTSE
ncbi:YdhK family protein [Jeotgalibacillus proteolyticus]|uniref:DUF1541 domain-containing protein n=1 Tax=Jeotgalibacillus proteolyticus TaxID=2082395 RepID=A0A2S5GCH2_9BACL|nr:YdhK family protein [Jeotgalibacillus proteolyticus]PPA70732.1 hypothetical protein C4B60_08025 [Jeotgalibacillus proteolyticus]